MYLILILSLLASILFQYTITFRFFSPNFVNYFERGILFKQHSDRIRFVLLSSFVILPIFFFNILKESAIKSNFLNVSILIIIICSSIFFIYFSKKIILTKKFDNLFSEKKEDVDIPIIKNISLKTTPNNIEQCFNDFIEKISNFEFYNATNNSFYLSDIDINIDYKQVNLNQRQLHLVLMVFWLEEIIEDVDYISSMRGKKYYKIFNEYSKKSCFEEVNKNVWSEFKNQYLLGGNLNKLKKTEFYQQLLKFYKINDTKVR